MVPYVILLADNFANGPSDSTEIWAQPVPVTEVKKEKPYYWILALKRILCLVESQFLNMENRRLSVKLAVILDISDFLISM